MVVNVKRNIGIGHGEDSVVVQRRDRKSLAERQISAVDHAAEDGVDRRIIHSHGSAGLHRHPAVIIASAAEINRSVGVDGAVELNSARVGIHESQRGAGVHRERGTMRISQGVRRKGREREGARCDGDARFVPVERSADQRVAAHGLHAGPVDAEIVIGTVIDGLVAVVIVIDGTPFHEDASVARRRPVEVERVRARGSNIPRDGDGIVESDGTRRDGSGARVDHIAESKVGDTPDFSVESRRSSGYCDIAEIAGAAGEDRRVAVQRNAAHIPKIMTETERRVPGKTGLFHGGNAVGNVAADGSGDIEGRVLKLDPAD